MTTHPTTSESTQPLTWENISRTYTGLLDDVMIRYSRDYADEQFFNRTIIKNVLFGGGVFINDGYLVLHEIARKQLQDDNSLLRYMINTDFVRVLTRTRSKNELREMPQMMADNGIQSYKDLVASTDWPNLSSLWGPGQSHVSSMNNLRVASQSQSYPSHIAYACLELHL